MTPAEENDYMLGLTCSFFFGGLTGFLFHWVITILQWKGMIGS